MLTTASSAVLEVAILDVLPDQTRQFESAFRQAEGILAAADGYIAHELQRCVEVPNRYVLVRWQSLASHTEGFRGSPGYQEWKRLLHHFYDPFPSVEHYQQLGT